MQRDYHFHAISVIARAAGFKVSDAVKIAYASQYVDDAVESEPLKVGKVLFDPVRTAHNGLKAFSWSIQKRVYFPFHYLPPRPLRRAGATFITQPGSKFAEMLWDHALAAPAGLARLCAMGVALHTIADTWAHQQFTGRENEENNVESIHHKRNGRWKKLFLPNIYLDLAPEIGHAEAGIYPDLPYLEWKYKRHNPAGTVVRDNTKDFMAASKWIYDRLRAVEQEDPADVVPWNRLAKRIHAQLSNVEEDLDERCEGWQNAFVDLIPKSRARYDAKSWRRDALRPANERNVVFETMRPEQLSRINFPGRRGFYQSAWVQFHRAALRQRFFVLENLM